MKEKKKQKTIHLQLNPEWAKKLVSYSESRQVNFAEAIRHALNILFNLEDNEYSKCRALEETLERKFTIPRNIPAVSFNSFLILLALRYPNDSAKSFWGELIYKSNLDKTNLEIVKEIKDSFDILVKEYSSEQVKSE